MNPSPQEAIKFFHKPLEGQMVTHLQVTFEFPPYSPRWRVESRGLGEGCCQDQKGRAKEERANLSLSSEVPIMSSVSLSTNPFF